MSLGVFFSLQSVLLVIVLGVWLVSRRSRRGEAPHDHDWSLWENTMIDMVNSMSGKTMYSVSGQRRRCKTCGLKEVKKVR